MTAALQMPVSDLAAEQRGPRLFRKQILKTGTINYKGRTLNFDRPYLSSLVDAFNNRAYDQVPIVLANEANEHHMNPEGFRGEVKGLEVADDGLYGLIELTDDGAKLVQDNPRLGVSARIVEQLERADGKQFKRAVQHVLATFDPRVTGMAGWQAVNLANDTLSVVDLTAETFTDPKEEGGMADLTDEQKARLDRLLALPDEQFNTLLAPTPPADSNNDGGDLSDDELNALLADLETDDQPVGAALSNEERAAIDLANAQAAEARNEVETLRRQLRDERLANECDSLVKAGYAPAIVNLARPLLEREGDDNTIELSNSDTTTIADQVRALLKAVGPTVDLSRVRGSLDNLDGTDDDETKTALEAWDRQFPAKR